jgi:riboflavin synthase
MFTGIVVATGRLVARAPREGDVELAIDAAELGPAAPGAASPGPARLAPGDSIAVQGVCLTVTRWEGRLFHADVSRETLEKTTLGQLELGARVNLEPALRLGDPLGGHMVSGHVDGLARLVSSTSDARSWRLRFELPHALARFVAPKGSICLDGVSLTVNEAADAQFGVNIIPHTHEVTTLGALQPGDAVNVEIDLIARYLDRLVHPAA